MKAVRTMPIDKRGLAVEQPSPLDNTADWPHQADEIGEITGRLRQRYSPSEISLGELAGRIRSYHHHFDKARIRSFVPILVENLTRRSIETPEFRPLPSAPA